MGAGDSAARRAARGRLPDSPCALQCARAPSVCATLITSIRGNGVMTQNGRTGSGAGGIHTTWPNVARIYDYLLGGKDNFAADREAARRLIQAIPTSRR